MVSCAVTVARRIAASLNEEVKADYPGIDGVMTLAHASGCAMDSEGIGLKTLQRTLAGWICNPNFAGVLLVGLGCEANQIESLLKAEGLAVGDRVHAVSIQQAGGTQAAIEQGNALLRQRLAAWDQLQRSTLSAEHLCVALQCGGSDGFSGISANPALGIAADKLVAAGGTVILAETPEIYGAEQLLKSRAVTEDIAQQLQAKVDWWRDYVAREGGTLDHNPSPGNKAGGLTTILEKSLGAVAKAGASPLQGVLDYGQRSQGRGLLFMDSPGYDPVSITGQIAAGANIVCFTTGRGSTYGSKPVPTLKLASNSAMATRMQGDMDIDCGPVLDGHKSVTEMGEEIFKRILALASGETSKSEQLDLGDDVFTPWQLGAVL
jgi:altronate hydrolase